MNNNIEELIQGLFAGNVRSLSRLMTLVETKHEIMPVVMKSIYNKRKRARRIGLSGPPGAGKSTLLSNLVETGVEKGHKIGVLCIDPTSPISGGALLGDRIRLSDSFRNDDVFIRSVASGESLGGLAEATKFHTLLLEAYGADLILIETVGLGQVGYDIRDIAESLILVLVPESGDTVQILKSGILELADIVVVNKSDRDGADQISMSLSLIFEQARSGWNIPVIKSVARDNIGTDDIWESLNLHYDYLLADNRLEKFNSPYSDLCEAMEMEFRRILHEDRLLENENIRKLVSDIDNGLIDPYSAAVDIINYLISEGKNG